MHAFNASYVSSLWSELCTFNLNKQTCDLNHAHSISMQYLAFFMILGWQICAQSPSSLPCQKWTPQKMRVVFSMPIHAARQELAHSVPTMAFLHPSLAATMCTAYHNTSSSTKLHAKQLAVGVQFLCWNNFEHNAGIIQLFFSPVHIAHVQFPRDSIGKNGRTQRAQL